MTNIPTPAEQAVATLAARTKEERKQKLLELCLAAIGEYDGTDCVSVTADFEIGDVHMDIRAEMNDWGVYRSKVAPSKLFLGSPAQACQKMRDEKLTYASVSSPGAPPPTLSILDGETVEVAAPAVVAAPTPVSPPAPAVSCTFKVHAVEPQTKKLGIIGGADVFKTLLKGPVEAFGIGHQLVRPMGMHALVETAHMAFAEHYGLEFAPDDIWQTIVHGFARIVNREPELFRGQFVTHEGQKEIRIRRDHFVRGSSGNDWAGCFDEFADAIGQHIGADKQKLLVSNFTTTGAIERAASNVALMDTVQAYFKYVVETKCGIPFVTLHGSVDDWKALAEKTRGLAQFGDIGWWLNDIIQIVDQFWAAAVGRIDEAFWGSLYKHQEGSGGIRITGWILKLLPFMQDWKENVVRNPLLGKPTCAPHVVESRRRSHFGDGADLQGDQCVNTSWLLSSLSTVPFIWEYLGTSYDYQFVAGLTGYSQNDANGALRPRMGWAVRPAK